MSKKCPMCKQPWIESFKPFCSVRCADLDLGKWILGDYRVPDAASEVEDADEES